MKITLTILKGPDQGRAVEFVRPRHYMIGRAHDMDFVLPEDDRYVSRRHVMLEIAPPNARVVDLAAKNPPHLNGVRIDTAALHDGDVLELGYTSFRIAIDQAVATWRGRCKGCNAELTLMEYEEEPARCGACPPLLYPPPAPAPSQYVCSACGCDLTLKAQSDGRADELASDVIYCCDNDKCLPGGDAVAGRSFGPYRAIRRLGTGGMGEVLLVYHADTARLLALKHVIDLTNKELVKRFIERETPFTAELRHPSLVRYIDRGVDVDGDGAPYLVMQYVPEGSLDDLIRPDNPSLAPDKAVDAVASALEGLAYIHAPSRKIIHRDIKPSNILLDERRRGRPGYAKLADFGLAVCYENCGGTRLTSDRAKMGTPMFMSPEQAYDSKMVRQTADTYSMGVTLYYLLTGAYSLDFPSRVEIARKAAMTGWRGIDPQHPDPERLARLGFGHSLNIILDPTVKPIPVRQRRPDLPPKLAEVVDRAVRKSEKERFASASAMRDALLAAVA
jgi:serine/threonine protein kinase